MSLLPLAVGLAVFAAVVGFLLDENPGLGRWLLAAFLVAHGLIHLLFFVPQAAPQPRAEAQPTAAGSAMAWPFDLSRSWLSGTGRLSAGTVRATAVGLVGLVVVGFGLAGLATGGLLVPAGAWSALLVVAAVGSLATFALVPGVGLLLGVAIDLAILWLATGAAWAPGTSLG